jgi:Fe-S-cluster-containing dehydrogenase component
MRAVTGLADTPAIESGWAPHHTARTGQVIRMVEIGCPYCETACDVAASIFAADQPVVRCEQCGVEATFADDPPPATDLPAAA